MNKHDSERVKWKVASISGPVSAIWLSLDKNIFYFVLNSEKNAGKL